MKPLSPLDGVDAGGGGDVAEVAVGDGQAGVAELVLDEVDGVALFGEFGGVGVAQAVGVDPFVDAGPGGEAGEELTQVGRVEGPAGQGAEQPPPRGDAEGAADVGPPLHDGQGLGV